MTASTRVTRCCSSTPRNASTAAPASRCARSRRSSPRTRRPISGSSTSAQQGLVQGPPGGQAGHQDVAAGATAARAADPLGSEGRHREVTPLVRSDTPVGRAWPPGVARGPPRGPGMTRLAAALHGVRRLLRPRRSYRELEGLEEISRAFEAMTDIRETYGRLTRRLAELSAARSASSRSTSRRRASSSASGPATTSRTSCSRRSAIRPTPSGPPGTSGTRGRWSTSGRRSSTRSSGPSSARSGSTT